MKTIMYEIKSRPNVITGSELDTTIETTQNETHRGEKT